MYIYSSTFIGAILWYKSDQIFILNLLSALELLHQLIELLEELILCFAVLNHSYEESARVYRK